MTRAAKMIEDWQYNGAGFELGQGDLLDLIRQVSERTRKECFKKVEPHLLLMHKDKVIAIKNSILDARWEDEKI